MNIGLFVLCIALTVGVFIIPIVSVIVGKVKLSHALKPIEYYPPHGYSPIDVLIKYYGFNAKAHEIINPLMLYWAKNGLITIEEDCKRGLKLTKLKEFDEFKDPNTVDPLFLKNVKTEKRFFNDIFCAGNVYYTLAAGKEYETVNSDFIGRCEDNAKACRTAISQKLSYISFAAALISLIINVAIIALTSVGAVLFGIMLFPIIGMIAFRFVDAKFAGNDAQQSAIITVIKYPFFMCWGGVPLCVALFILPLPTYGAAIIGISTLLSAISVIKLSDIIDIRSAADIEIYGRICAFKTFLLNAERDRIETLVEENPDYYYDVLPYCYALKITKKLKTKFDRITLDGPSWYLGSLRDTLMF